MAPPTLADHLRAAVLDWLEADGRSEVPADEIVTAFAAALRDALTPSRG